MEDINNLIEEAIVKYDNFGDKKPTKQSSVKAYRDILCKLHIPVKLCLSILIIFLMHIGKTI